MDTMDRSVKRQSNSTEFSILHSDKFMIYNLDFFPVELSPKYKLKFILSICEENKLPGAFCFEENRLFTSEKWHGESDIQEFIYDNKNVILRIKSTFLPDSEEYYQMINVLLNNLQVMMGQEWIGNGYFLSPNITQNEIPLNNGPTYFETDSSKILGGFGTTLQRVKKSNGKIPLEIKRINKEIHVFSVMKAYNKRYIDQLIGKDVITKFNDKTYRISEIKEMNIDDKCKMGGRMQSYAEYFKEQYNISLTKHNQPFVLGEECKEKDITITIPSELCFLCDFSDQEKYCKDLQKSLKREPSERLNDIPAFRNWIKNNDDANKMYNMWQLDI